MSTPLENSRRVLPKMTFSPLKVRVDGDGDRGNMLTKLGMVAGVTLPWTIEEIDGAIEAAEDTAVTDFLKKYKDQVATIEGDRRKPLRTLLSDTDDAVVAKALGAVAELQRVALEAAKADLAALPPAPERPFPYLYRRSPRSWRDEERGPWNWIEPFGGQETPYRPLSDEERKRQRIQSRISNLESQTTKAAQAVMELAQTATTEPLGLLFIERLTLTPSDLERGELVYSLPLAPKEKVTVSHKEWRIRQEEFTQAIQDWLERYSERGVASATELSASTTDLSARTDATRTSNTRRSGNTAREGASNVTTTEQIDAVSADNVTQHEITKTATVRESRTATELASSRSIQDHKVSFTVTTVAGSEDFTSRILQNPSDKQTMRVDYFRRMLQWKVKLEREDVRLTYAVVVPDPGYRLRQPYLELQRVQAALAQGFVFDLNPATITSESVAGLEATYGTSLPALPAGAALPQWQKQSWELLRSAAWARFTAAQESARQRRDVLQKIVGDIDVLRLRRLEHEELTYHVMKWLFPPLNTEWTHREESNQYSIEWENALEYGEYIHFTHEAVDWDNLLVSLYPHFWDANSEAEGKPFLTHPDPEHREFLRAGAARVILPIRPGFEHKVLSLIENGEVGTLEDDHRFVKVIEKVTDEHDARARGPLVLGDWPQWTPTGALDLDVVVRPTRTEP